MFQCFVVSDRLLRLIQVIKPLVYHYRRLSCIIPLLSNSVAFTLELANNLVEPLTWKSKYRVVLWHYFPILGKS